MQASDVLISKPGGITLSEALAKALPMIIVKPIPGQEQMNTDYLVKNGVAAKIDDLRDIGPFVAKLFDRPDSLAAMRERAGSFASPRSASDIASAILERIG